MKTTENTVKFTNSKTVEVKLLVPYVLITIVVCAFMGVVTGWNLREEMSGKVKAEAASIVGSMSKDQK